MGDYDGSIIIGTQINTDGIDTGLKEVETKVGRANDGFKKLGNTIKSISLSVLTVAMTAIIALFGKAVEQSEVAKGRMEAIKQTINGYINMLAAKLEPLVLRILDLIEKLLPIIMQIGDVLLDYVIPVVETLVDSLMWAIDKIVWIINNVGGVNTGLISENTKDYTKYANEYADSMEKANKSTKATTKEAAKLKKQLMGFDEMNVLNDSGGTSAIGGISLPKAIKKITTEDFVDKETLERELIGLPNWVQEKVLKQWNAEQLAKRFKENGFTKTFTELLIGKKEDNEKKVNEIKPIITDFFNGVATTRQNAITQFLKTPWINSFFGSNSDIDNKKTKILDANSIIGTSMDTVATKSKTDANVTKTSWIQTATDIIKKYADKTPTGVAGAVTGALDSITTTSEKDTKTALDKIKTLINNFKPSPKTVTIKADTTNFDKAVKKVKDFLSGKGVYNVTINGTHTGGGRYGAKGLIIPRLASGGIINRPGRGIPLADGGAIAGERGREAVLPLTDSLQMQKLGEEIAKNIVVNLTNEVRLDGKQLSRYISKVMQDTQFSSNGGVI